MNDILDKEHAKQVSRFVINARAASTAGDRSLVELLGAVEQAERKGDEGKAVRFRKGIEKFLEENGLCPVTLQPEG